MFWWSDIIYISHKYEHVIWIMLLIGSRRYARQNARKNVRCQKDCQQLCQKQCQKICQIECQKECQKICQNECQKRCQKEYQETCQKICEKTCQKRCQKKIGRYAGNNVRTMLRYTLSENCVYRYFMTYEKRWWKTMMIPILGIA